MKVFIIIIITVVWLPFFSSAQSNYKPGYVISLKGDTLKGDIDYREWDKNPRRIAFRDNSGALQQYIPQNIRGFGIAGFEYYETHIVKVSLDSIDFATAGRVMRTHSHEDTLFLRLLNTGPILSFYSYRDAIKDRYYAAEHNDTEPTELDYHLYVDSSEAIRYVRRYRIQLQSIAQKNSISNEKLTSRILSADYSEHDLLKIAATMNGSDSRQLSSAGRFGTRFFVGAGISYTDMVFTGAIQYDDNYSVFPKVDAGMDFLVNKTIQRLFLRLEVAATTDEHIFARAADRSELKFRQNTASLIPQVYYSVYNSSSLKVFIAGGIAINISIYPIHYYSAVAGLDHDPVSTNQPPTVLNNFPDYHTHWESLVLKAGVTINKKIEIYAGYTPATTITNDIPLAGTVVFYQAGVNFLFGPQ